MNKKALLTIVCIALVTVVFGQASAVEKALSTEMQLIEDSLTDAQIGLRLQRLQNEHEKNEQHAGNWWKTWVVLYGAATIGQGAVAVTTHQKPLRQDMIVGAGTTLLGVANQFLTPVTTGFRPIDTDSIAKLSFSQKVQKLAEGEEILKKQAQIAKAGKGWQAHALSGAVNLASGLITWIGFKRSFGDGVFNFALNTVITGMVRPNFTRLLQHWLEFLNFILAENRIFVPVFFTPTANEILSLEI
ncbi:MAG: hypothetical protein NTY32_13335 [Bacteroidia bacterium]|nr:hypothetical protein [Bacteroidia bacterium]